MANFLTGLQNIASNITSGISSYEIRNFADKVQNVVMNYTETETKVREATNDDPWGPTGPLMAEIAQCTNSYEGFPEVMGSLWKRMLTDNKRNWRRVYKSLILLNHLIKNGSEKVVSNARDHLYDLRSLETYQFTDDNGKDQGINVRHRVKEVIELLQDDERLRRDRKLARQVKSKYGGISSNDYGGRSFHGESKSRNDFDDFKRRQFSRQGQPSSFDAQTQRRNSFDGSNSGEFDNGNNNDFHDFEEENPPAKNTPPSRPKVSNSVDFFAANNPKNNSSVVSSTVQLPRPPSPQIAMGSGKQNQQNQHGGLDLLGEVFGDVKTESSDFTQFEQFETKTTSPNIVDDFADFTHFPAATPVESPPAPLQSNNIMTIPPFANFAENIMTTNNNTNNNIDVQTKSAFIPNFSNSPSLQFQSSINSTVTLTPISTTSSDLNFQAFCDSTPAIEANSNTQLAKPTKSTTWTADLNKVNIDLDSLFLGKSGQNSSTTKGQGLSLKEMQLKQLNQPQKAPNLMSPITPVTTPISQQQQSNMAAKNKPNQQNSLDLIFS